MKPDHSQTSPSVAELASGGAARFARPWPSALLWAVAIAAGLSLLTWASGRVLLQGGEHKLLILGDSVVANYRCRRGERIQDTLQAQLGPTWNVRNFAEPGARIPDYYLLLSKAELLGFHPELVVITLPPQKLVAEVEPGSLLDEDGSLLRWLPLNREGLEYFRRLDGDYRTTAIVKKASLVFGFYEAVRDLWLEHIEWPTRYRRMQHANPRERRRHALALARMLGARWEREVRLTSYEELRASRASKDLEFLVRAVQSRGARVLVLVPPWPHKGFVKEAFSASLQQKFSRSRDYTLRWCRDRGLAVIDLSSPEALRSFSPEDWDDMEHLRSAAAYRRIAQGVGQWLVEAARGHG